MKKYIRVRNVPHILGKPPVSISLRNPVSSMLGAAEVCAGPEGVGWGMYGSMFSSSPRIASASYPADILLCSRNANTFAVRYAYELFERTSGIGSAVADNGEGVVIDGDLGLVAESPNRLSDAATERDLSHLTFLGEARFGLLG